MNNFGQFLQELRKEAGLSQAELAKAANLSQATVSRFEGLEGNPSDIRVLSRIAKALKRPLADFLPEVAAIAGSEQFSAFCPNPFCRRNNHKKVQGGQVYVYWNSWESYPSEQFVDVNFCPQCGTELIKECTNCKRRFPQEESRFCIRCGEQICNRPTEEEWKIIEKSYAEEPRSEPDIPF